jgi:hypothetical protein
MRLPGGGTLGADRGSGDATAALPGGSCAGFFETRCSDEKKPQWVTDYSAN